MSRARTDEGEIKTLRKQVAEMEKHSHSLLIAERRACEARQSLSQQLQLLQKANDLGKILSSTRSPAGMLEETINFVVREFSYEAGAILLLDGSLKTIRVEASAGGSDSIPQTLDVAELKRKRSILWTSLEENQPIVVEEKLSQEDPAVVFNLESFFIVPLGVEKSIPVGLIILGNTAAHGVYYRRVKNEDAPLIATIARQTAFVLDKAELYEHLQREKDDLERAELQLLSVNESLEERVQEKTKALQESMEELEESRRQLEHYSRELEVEVEERTKQLRESERIYRSVMANSRAGMAFYRKGVILEVNPALTEIVGQALEGQKVTSLVEKVVSLERQRELEHSLVQGECDGENEGGNFEIQARRGDEERVWNVSTFSLDEESGLCGFLVVDTTETRRVKEQLFSSQKMASLGNLAGGFAHEFNNILVGILGNASLLRTRVAGSNDVSGLAEMIEASAVRAAELVQQLLGFARKGKYRSELLDINGIVRDTLHLARRSFGPRIEIALDLADGLYPVEGDATQIQQVVMNLALNAKEAIGDEGTLTARTRSLNLDKAAARDVPGLSAGCWAEIEIADTGRGMDEELQKMIFEPFFTTKESGSPGLGLPMVYGIVTNHGGTIEVRSRVGEGTSLCVYLPAAVSGACAEGATEDARQRGNGEHILVVDDEDILRRVCRDALTHFGYEVHVEEDGEDACEYVRSGRPVDLILLDLEMPRKSGKESYREIKELRPDVKIVICTGYSQDGLPEGFTEGEAPEVLIKPFTCQALRETVQKVLGKGQDQH
jgi:PAS domain S-box-containing protein